MALVKLENVKIISEVEEHTFDNGNKIAKVRTVEEEIYFDRDAQDNRVRSVYYTLQADDAKGIERLKSLGKHEVLSVTGKLLVRPFTSKEGDARAEVVVKPVAIKTAVTV